MARARPEQLGWADMFQLVQSSLRATLGWSTEKLSFYS